MLNSRFRCLTPQVIMHLDSDEPVAQRLQISGHTIFTSELEMLCALLEQGCCWGLLPTHMHAAQWKNVNTLRTEVGSQGICQTMVIIWKPGNDRRALIDETLALLPGLRGEVGGEKLEVKSRC